MANSVDPDQTAPSGAVWSGSSLVAYATLSKILVYEILGHLPYYYYYYYGNNNAKNNTTVLLLLIYFCFLSAPDKMFCLLTSSKTKFLL